MKKNLFTLLALMTSACLAFAEASFDFSFAIPKGWTATVAPRGFEDRGAQFTDNTILTLSGVGNVTTVTVVCSANEADANSIEVFVGETSIGLKVLPKENGQTLTFTSEAELEGDLKIVITRTKKSVWIKSVTVGGSYDPGDIPEEDPTEGLDHEYVYSEPTKVISTGEEGSKITYSFICNNVKVIANLGTKTDTYFGANAGTTLTFVTTRNMKAIVVDGFVRKAFTATASSGTIAYKSSSSVDLEEEEVLAVTDIDANVLTLYCDKQLRCNEVRIYFDENPDINIHPEEELNYSYYWEPEEAVTMDIVFDRLEYQDMTENMGYACSSFLFYNDTYEMNLVIFASATDESTILPSGSYPINDTYAENTVQASPGGDEYYDYPSCVFTDFETDGEGTERYNPYYIVSGMLVITPVEGGATFTINAVTYNGSVISATYVHVVNAADNAIVPTEAIVSMRNGIILLRSNGATYSITGNRL